MKNSSSPVGGFMSRTSSNAQRRRFNARPRRMRVRVDQNTARRYADVEGGHFLGERRRRGAGIRPVLVAVPRADDTAVDDAPFAQRTVLMLTNVRDRRDASVVAEHGHALTRETGHVGALLGNLRDTADVDESVRLDAHVLDVA